MTIFGLVDIAQPVDLGMIAHLRERMSQPVDFAELGSAAAIILLALFLGHLAANMLAKRIARFIDGKGDDEAPERFQPILKAAATILRYASAAIILLIARDSWGWQLFAELLIGLTLAFAVSIAVHALLRALNLGFWTAIAASAALFAFVFSNSVGGLTSMNSLLDSVSFAIGDRRFSLLTLVSAGLVGIFLVALVRLGNSAVRMLLTRNESLDDGQRLLGEKLTMVALVVLAFFIGIDLLGIDLTAFAVFSGAFGLAIGFGLQKTFGNLIAGIILLMDRSIKPGDVIALGDTYGWVNKIGTRAVSIITRDGKEHLIPNENLMTEEVENWSFSSKNVRVRMPVGVSYSSDMDLVEELLRQSLEDHKRVLKRPAPRILMTGFGDSSVDFEVRAWIRDPESGVTNFKSDIYKRIWVLFKENDIEIPFPQRDINFRNSMPEAVKAKAVAKKKARKKPAAKPKPKS
ncbi:MAG: mechanosensitive ion channel domain-containing protein [Sphingorhabdus sp.]